MENVDTKKRINGLPSTIVAGIFLTIAVAFTILLLFMNLKIAVDEYVASVQESANENSENAGEMIIVATLFAGFGLLAIYILFYAVVFIPFIIAHFCLIPVIKNLKHTDNQVIKIINFVYLGLIITIAVICILKFILFATQVG